MFSLSLISMGDYVEWVISLLKSFVEFMSESNWTCCFFFFGRLLIIDSIYLLGIGIPKLSLSLCDFGSLYLSWIWSILFKLSNLWT